MMKFWLCAAWILAGAGMVPGADAAADTGSRSTTNIEGPQQIEAAEVYCGVKVLYYSESVIKNFQTNFGTKGGFTPNQVLHFLGVNRNFINTFYAREQGWPKELRTQLVSHFKELFPQLTDDVIKKYLLSSDSEEEVVDKDENNETGDSNYDPPSISVVDADEKG